MTITIVSVDEADLDREAVTAAAIARLAEYPRGPSPRGRQLFLPSKIGLAAGGRRIRTLGPPLGEVREYEISRQDREIASMPTAAWRGLVRPAHQLPGRSAILRNLTDG